jgi:hypothetical protein
VRVVPLRRLRADRLGLKRSCSIACSTACRLSAATRAVPLRMRETVLGETPASRATSCRVLSATASGAAGAGPAVARLAAERGIRGGSESAAETEPCGPWREQGGAKTAGLPGPGQTLAPTA